MKSILGIVRVIVGRDPVPRRMACRQTPADLRQFALVEDMTQTEREIRSMDVRIFSYVRRWASVLASPHWSVSLRPNERLEAKTDLMEKDIGNESERSRLEYCSVTSSFVKSLEKLVPDGCGIGKTVIDGVSARCAAFPIRHPAPGDHSALPRFVEVLARLVLA